MGRVKVVLLYVDGCPNWSTAKDRLTEAVRLAGRTDTEIEYRRIETSEEAAACGFIGSPTILIDGRDPFAEPGAQASVSCRIYRTPEGLSGAPTVAQLREAFD
ncbi:hypothetical protein NGTWS1803_00650 [Mycolicibacterium cyprinidarum]|nr:hypothetical protein NGTWS1803_00650 [Mycolicibacterium sp. NGTWS1803]